MQKNFLFIFYFNVEMRLSKVTGGDIVNVSNKGCSFELSIIQRIVKNKCISFHKTFNIGNNKKCFLSSKSAYYYDVTLKTGVMMLKIQL